MCAQHNPSGPRNSLRSRLEGRTLWLGATSSRGSVVASVSQSLGRLSFHLLSSLSAHGLVRLEFADQRDHMLTELFDLFVEMEEAAQDQIGTSLLELDDRSATCCGVPIRFERKPSLY